MARTRSERVERMKSELVGRLKAGFCRPGNHFISNRELTTRYGVSYQTAHRIIREMEDEGYLHRVPSSGTYVAASTPPPEGVALVFHPKAVEEGFGCILLRLLQERFDREGIPHTHVSGVVFEQYVPGRYNIVWGQEFDVRRLPSHLCYSLMIDGRPESGVNATFTDSIYLDYVEVGRICGNLLQKKGGIRRVAVLAGQADNDIYQDQLRGFQEFFPDCEVRYQDDWSYWEALKSAESLRGGAWDGFFSVNDGGVMALQDVFGYDVPMTAFGNGTRWQAGGVEGVIIPWEQIVEETVHLYRKRSEGDIGVGYQRVITPEPPVPSEVPLVSYAS